MERIYSLNTIMKNLLDNNFIAFVSTSWHTYGLKCIVDELQSKGIYLQGYIVILPTIPGSDQYYIDSENFPLSNYSSNLKIVKCSLEKSRGNLCLLLIKQFLYCIRKERKGSFFFVVNAGIPAYDMAREIERKYQKAAYNIVIDEGLATYMGLANNFDVLNVDTYYESIKRNIRLFFTFMLKKRKSHLYYFILFQGKLKNLYLNEKVVIKYKEKLFHDSNGLENKISYKNSIIILTQPFVEVGELYANLDYSILKNLVEYLYRICDYEIIIKTHPKETNKLKYDGLNCKVEKRLKLSFEELMSQCIDMPVAVVGFTSTALVTASIFWNIPAYSLCHFLKGEEVSVELKRIRRKFSDGFGNYVKIIKNLEELEF